MPQTSVEIATRLAVSPRAVRAFVYALFAVAGIAQAAIVPLLPRISDHYHLTGAQTALVLALPGFATLVVSVPAGVVADRFGARRATLGAAVLIVLSSLTQAVPSLTALLAGRVAFGVAFGVVWTTGMAWLAELDGGSGRSSLGAPVTYSSAGTMLGPAIAGALAQHAGLAAPFVALAIAAAAVTVPLAACGATSPPPPPPAAAAVPGAADVGPALLEAVDPTVAVAPHLSPRELAALIGRPRVSAAAAALVISGAVSSAGQLLISTGLHHAGVSTSHIGLAFTAGAISYIAVSGAVVRLGGRALTLRFNAVLAVLAAIGLVPAAISGGAVALVAALLLTTAPRGAISTIAYGLASGQRQGSATGDGVVFGILNGAWAAATVVTPVLAGAVAEGAGAGTAFLVVIVAACAISAWLVASAAGPAWSGRLGPAPRRVARALGLLNSS